MMFSGGIWAPVAIDIVLAIAMVLVHVLPDFIIAWHDDVRLCELLRLADVLDHGDLFGYARTLFAFTVLLGYRNAGLYRQALVPYSSLHQGHANSLGKRNKQLALWRLQHFHQFIVTMAGVWALRLDLDTVEHEVGVTLPALWRAIPFGRKPRFEHVAVRDVCVSRHKLHFNAFAGNVTARVVLLPWTADPSHAVTATHHAE